MEHLEDLVKVWPIIVGIIAVIVAWCDRKAENKTLAAAIENMRREFKEDIARLERKQDKYNTLQERMVKTEIGLLETKNTVTELKGRVHEYHH